MNEPRPLFATVLLVEDDPAHAMLIQRALRSVVEHITVCTTVAAARQHLQEHPPELIISDLNLPDQQRDGVVEAFRSVASEVPLVVLTSLATVAAGVSAMRAGASDFLVKSFDATFRDVLHLALNRIRVALDRQREQQQVVRDRDLLREAVENSTDGLAVVHRDGTVRYCNAGFEEFLGSFQGAAQSGHERTLFQIAPHTIERGEELLARLRERCEHLPQGAVWATEVVGKEDHAFDLSVAAARRAGEPHEESLLVVWVRDIRERKRRERSERDVVSTTTHDLKGPLGAISLSCGVLLDRSRVDQESYAMVERIAASAASAMHLIEEFLSVRQLEDQGVVMRPYPHELARGLGRVLETYALAARTRGVELRCEEPAAWAELRGCVDPLGFERVLHNLVSNALKFTPSGGSVTVAARHVEGGVVLAVRDSGSGMEPVEAQGLFSRYTRLPRHTTVAGTGLGLFIVKCIVSAHGGSIDVTSAPGQGSTFEVFFPDTPPCNDRGEVICIGTHS